MTVYFLLSNSYTIASFRLSLCAKSQSIIPPRAVRHRAHERTQRAAQE